MYTTHFTVKDFKNTAGFININGYGANEAQDGTRVAHKDVQSLKYAYPKNFMLNHMN